MLGFMEEPEDRVKKGFLLTPFNFSGLALNSCQNHLEQGRRIVVECDKDLSERQVSISELTHGFELRETRDDDQIIGEFEFEKIRSQWKNVAEQLDAQSDANKVMIVKDYRKQPTGLVLARP